MDCNEFVTHNVILATPVLSGNAPVLVNVIGRALLRNLYDFTLSWALIQ